MAHIVAEVQRGHNGHVEDEEAAFYTIEEAREWVDVMRNSYGYRKAWINGVEYDGKR